MSIKSKEVDLDQATAGMELACDLVDPRGTVLLQQGSILSDSVLAALARRGIERLRVLGAPGDDEDVEANSADAAARERAGARLAHLFRHGAEGATAELRARLQDYRVGPL